MCGKFIATGLAGALCIVATWVLPAHAANGVVGPGNCNQDGFAAVLATVDGSGGGTITFNCGTATIAFTSYKPIAHAVTIDGGGTITFDGGGTSPFFQVYFSANVTLRRLTLQHGAYAGGVRAIENIGNLTLDRVRVTGNSSTLGPVLNSGALKVSSSTFSNNAANSASSHGGAIENNGGTVNIGASTFNGNSSSGSGGAIYSDGSLKVTNSTFNANSATGGGGAIYQTDGDGYDGRLTYVTLAGNSAAYGAGVYKDAGDFRSTLTVSRSLLSGNNTGNCDGVLTSGGYNLSSDSNCGAAFTAATHDLNNANLPMGPLAGNGGPTQTMTPQSGNAAINYVPSAQCQIPADQRGGGRPSGGACDSGAVEVNAVLDLIFYDGFE